jgi:A/G-specific adenine glycosylase
MLLHKLDNRLLLERRPAQGIWGGLWSLPELQDVNELGDWQLRKMGKSFSEVSLHHKVLQHNFSHFDLDISLALVDLSNRHVDTSVSAIHDEDDLSWIEQDALDCYGLPAPVSRLLSEVLDASGEVSFAWNP